MKDDKAIGPLLALSGGYWQTCALHAGVALDVFSHIAAGVESVDGLALATASQPRALGMLLRALAAMGLVKPSGTSFELTPTSETFLVKDSPRYTGHIILHHHKLMASWASLPQAVRQGGPVRHGVAQSEEDREAFLMGMFNLAMGIAPGLAQTLDLSGRKRLLDLGGGPGTYAVQFCLANPGLTASVFDMPTSEPFARQVAQRFGVANRVDFVPGDFLADPLPKGYDVMWLSQILHGEPPKDCQRIVDKAVAALAPGGEIFIHEFILDDAGPGPLFPALFSLNMLLVTPGGQSYTEAEFGSMLTNAGAKNVIRLDFCGPNNSGIVRAQVD